MSAYPVDAFETPAVSQKQIQRFDTLKTWHNRLFHPSDKRMARLIRDKKIPGVAPSDLTKLRSTGWSCESCIYGKPHQVTTKIYARGRSSKIGPADSL